jgi:GTP cyclohydrolase I
LLTFFSRRPQVQERLTVQIAEELKKALQTEDVAVAITADHMCVTLRGIKDQDSSTYTSSFHGKFKEKEYRKEFLDQIKA